VLQLSGACGAFEPLGASDVLLLDIDNPTGRLLRRSPELPFTINLAPTLNVVDFRISPDEELVCFLANTTSGSGTVLYSVPSDGSSTPVAIAEVLPPGGTAPAHRYAFSADGALVLFLVPRAFGPDELHAAPSDGSAPAWSVHVPTGGNQLIPNDFSSAGPDQVVFRLRVGALGQQHHLYSAAIEGSGPAVRLTGNGSGAWGVGYRQASISPDGSRVVYLEYDDTSWRLFRVPSDGSQPPTPVHPPLVTGGNVDFAPSSSWLSSDGERIVYRADQEEDERFELFSAPLDGRSPAIRLHPALLPGADVQSYLFTSDTPARVVFLADLERVGCLELYSVPADGSAAPRRLNRSLAPFPARDVFDYNLSRDGRGVLYVANQDSPFGKELHCVPSDGHRPDERLTPLVRTPSPDLDISWFEARAGSVVFLSNRRAQPLWDLHGHNVPTTLPR
jgi:Tol biopolymer transport system component